MSFVGKNPKFDSTIIKDEGSGGSPSAPASGAHKIINRNGALYMKSSAGTEVPVGKSSGVLNVIVDPDGETGVSAWVDSGTGTTVSQTTTAGKIPLTPLKTSAILISNDGTGTGYTRFRWTMPEAWKNTNIGISWFQRPESGYADNDYKVEVYVNAASDYSGAYTEIALFGDNSSGLSYILNETGTYSNGFTSTASDDYYELRIVRVAGSNGIALNDATVTGSRSSVTGPAVGGWTDYTDTVLNGGSATFSYTARKWRRVGDSIEVMYSFTVTGGGSGGTAINIPLPNGYTADESGLTEPVYGTWHFYSGSTFSYGGQLTSNGAGGVQLIEAGTATTIIGSELGVNERYQARFTVKVSGLSGTLNTLQEDNLSEWTSYTPGLQNITIGNGTINGYYRRVGSDMEVSIYLEWGSTSSASGILGFDLPLTYTIDSSSIPNLTSSLTSFGTATASDVSPGTNYTGIVVHGLTTSYVRAVTNNSGSPWASTVPFGAAWATGDKISLNFRVPITQWKNKNQNTLVGFSQATATNSGLMKLPGKAVTTLADGSNPAITSTSLVDVTGLSLSITTTRTSRIAFAFSGSVRNNVAASVNYYNIMVNGVLQFGTGGLYNTQDSSGYFYPVSMCGVSQELPAGTYTVKLQAKVSANTMTWLADSTSSCMISAWEV